ncbi:MAG: riboflavin synthase [Alphaproteobacteria bacterium]
MFTGIITDIGEITAIKTPENKEDWVDLTIGVKTSFDMNSVDMGASIACSGVCLTVVAKDNGYFEADVSAESIAKTTISDWAVGTKINLERALKMGDELGGHLVSGHVDTTMTIKNIEQSGESHIFTFEVPEKYMKYIASKGSVVIDGTSLTVNDVDENTFNVNIIPHTLENTIFKEKSKNDKVNLEVDLLSRYVARILGKE